MTDVKFALRSFTKAPGFTLLAVAIMALGIGANTAVFTVLNTVLLKPLPYRDPDRIVSLLSSNRKTGLPSGVSEPNFHDWHDQSNAFDAMAYIGEQRATVIVENAEAEFLFIAFVTPEFFRVFAVEPIFGRLFMPEESRFGDPPAVVVSHAFWQSHFGGTLETARQRTIRMHDRSIPIVGVLPPGFHYPVYSAARRTDAWILADTIFGEGQNRSANGLTVVGRLKPGMSPEQAQAQMTAIGERLERQYPESNRDKGVTVTPMRELMVRGVKPTLYLLLGGVAVLLMTACANMANLLLAKAAERTRELAIRAALGATRGRILRQLLTESALLALLSGAAGLILAFWGTRAVLALARFHSSRLRIRQHPVWNCACAGGLASRLEQRT
jgi:predicted permease